jgi:hypothetical protein
MPPADGLSVKSFACAWRQHVQLPRLKGNRKQKSSLRPEAVAQSLHNAVKCCAAGQLYKRLQPSPAADIIKHHRKQKDHICQVVCAEALAQQKYWW